MGKLEKIIKDLKKECESPRKIRQHKNNILHHYSRIMDYYLSRGMNYKDSMMSAKQKLRTLYNINKTYF